jgi:hypothetical protein
LPVAVQVFGWRGLTDPIANAMRRMNFHENPTAAVMWCLVLTAAIEVITCLLRFYLNLEATRDTADLGQFTLGVRIHHGYVGLVVIVLGLLLARGPALTWTLIIGAALLFSDLIHHFLVLWPITGSPEFDFFYP